MHTRIQSKIVSITFPEETYAKIEAIRGDISRSRYILRLIEKAMKGDETAALSKLSASFETVQCQNNKHEDCEEVYSNTELNLEAVCSCSCHSKH